MNDTEESHKQEWRQWRKLHVVGADNLQLRMGEKKTRQMSAIKYIGRHLWRVKVSHDFLDTRITTKLWVTTSSSSGNHIDHAVRATRNYLLNAETMPNAKIESINYRGIIDA